jgi:ATP-dependent protease ClpP protease subunit
MSTREILARLSATVQRPAAQAPTQRPRARVENVGTTAQVWLYEEIGGFGIWAADLVPALAQLQADQIEVHLNSPGGDYFDGVAIANGLANHPANVVVHVDGLAASAASVIAMAGDEIIMHPGSQMMIHDAITGTYGNAGEHKRTEALLDKVSADIAALYASRAGGDAGTWRTQMLAETWLSAEEAVTSGLANSIGGRQLPAGQEQPQSWQALLSAYRAGTDLSSSAPHETSAPVAAAVQPGTALPEAPALPTLSELVCSALHRKAVA